MSRSSGERRSHPLTRAVAPLAVAGVVTAATLALRLRDPHVAGSWGFCPFNVLTGAYCPGCGGLRAVNDLTHLDLAAAASSNLLLVAAVPVLAWLWTRWLATAWTGRSRPASRAPLMTATVLAALLAGALFSVLRNVPAGAWLAP